jgi:hypothetical protein
VNPEARKHAVLPASRRTSVVVCLAHLIPSARYAGGGGALNRAISDRMSANICRDTEASGATLLFEAAMIIQMAAHVLKEIEAAAGSLPAEQLASTIRPSRDTIFALFEVAFSLDEG